MIPTYLWGCRDHWFRLPKSIRTGIRENYQPGRTPSPQYWEALMAAARWVRDYGGAAR